MSFGTCWTTEPIFFSKPVRKKPRLVQKSSTRWSRSRIEINDEKEDIEDLNSSGTNIHDNEDEKLSDRSDIESDVESKNSAPIDYESELENEDQYYVKWKRKLVESLTIDNREVRGCRKNIASIYMVFEVLITIF